MRIICLSLLLSKLGSISAWDSDGSCDGCSCDTRQSDQGGTATKFNSPMADIANGFLWSENRKNGLLLRTPDFEKSLPWSASSSVNVAQRAPNPDYKASMTDATNPMCPSNGKQCEDSSTWGWLDCNGADDKIWELAEISLMYGRHYMMNDGHDGHLSNDVTISGCYPTDANSVDQRTNPKEGENGLGCDPSQYFGCTDDGQCITLAEDNCKCNYDVIPGVEYGTQLAKSFEQASQGNPGALYYEGDGYCFTFGEKLQPAFVAFDYASCYYTPDNTGDDVLPNGGSFRHMIEASNSLWQNRGQLLNWNIPLEMQEDISYWGWNECAASYKNGNNLDTYLDVADAVLIILPAMDSSSHADGYPFSLCDLSDHALDVLLSDLHQAHKNGWGGKPFLLMEQTSGMDPDDCATYWDNTKSTCGDGYRKGISSQNFYFKDGSCLLVDGDSEVKFYNADPNTNADHWQADATHCCAAWPNFCLGVGAEPDSAEGNNGNTTNTTTSGSIAAGVSTLIALLPVVVHYF